MGNLTKCEHHRWNVSNRILGYRTYENANGNQKYYLQKRHTCMVSNKALTQIKQLRDTMMYDYNTILYWCHSEKQSMGTQPSLLQRTK